MATTKVDVPTIKVEALEYNTTNTSITFSRWQFRLSYFPDCCAYHILSNIHGENTALKDITVALYKYINGEYPISVAPYLLATTTEHQRNANKFLRSLGFKKVGTSIINPNTGNRVTMWRVSIDDLAKHLRARYKFV